MRAFAVNATGPLLMAKHFLPLLRHPDRAVVGTVSARSAASATTGAAAGTYRASKAAQNAVTKTLSIELANRARTSSWLRCTWNRRHTTQPFQRNVPPK